MPRLPQPGSDDDVWGDILNEFLGISHNADGTIKDAAIASKADDTSAVHTTSDEDIDGIKSFIVSPIVPTPTNPTDAANKDYVDTTVIAGTPDATNLTKGKLRLTGDLAGTAASPTVTFANDSLHVLKTGDTMTGQLNILGDSSNSYNLLQLKNTSGGPYLKLGNSNTDATPAGYIGLYRGASLVGELLSSASGSTLAGSGLVDLLVAGSTILRVTPSDAVTWQPFRPQSNNAITLGTSSYYWSQMYASRHYFNSTAYIDGASAGILGITGKIRVADGTGHAFGRTTMLSDETMIIARTTGEGDPTIPAGTVAVFQNNAATGFTGSVQFVAGTTGNFNLNFGDKDNSSVGSIGWSNNINQFTINGTTNFAGTVLPSATNTYGLGTTSTYWANIYAQNHYLNSTAYFSGATAGVATLNGQLKISAPSVPVIIKDTTTGDTVGGLNRLVTSAGVFRIDTNTAAGSDFSTYLARMSLDLTTGAVGFSSTANPGLTVGDGTTGYFKLGDATLKKLNGSFFSFNGDGIQGVQNLIIGQDVVDTTKPFYVKNSLGDATRVVETIQGMAAQTGNLTEWRDSTPTVLSVVDATGKIGVGIASPGAMLNIYAATASTQLRLGNGINSWEINRDNVTTGRLAFVTNNPSTEVMTLRNDGSVGIGQPSPSYRLHVTGGSVSIDNGRYLNFEGTSSATWRIGRNIVSRNTNVGVSTSAIQITTTTTASEGFQITDSSSANPYFEVNGNTGNAYLKGQLGLGVTPTHTLTLPSTGTGLAIYNTSDQTTNYERVRQYWTGNVYQIAGEKGGTGALRDIRIASGNRFLNISDSGAAPHFTFGASVGYGANSNAFVHMGDLSNQVVNSSNLFKLLSLSPLINQSGTASYTVLVVNPTETGVGSGAKLLADFQVGGTSKASIDNTGIVTAQRLKSNTALQQAVGTQTVGVTLTTANAGINLCDATTAGFTITIPAATTATGFTYTIKKVDATGNVVTIGTSGGNIDGAATASLSVQYKYVTVISDGTNWFVTADN